MKQFFSILNNWILWISLWSHSYRFETHSVEELTSWLYDGFLRYLSPSDGQCIIRRICSQQQVIGSVWVPFVSGNEFRLQWTCFVCTRSESDFVCKVFNVSASTILPIYYEITYRGPNINEDEDVFMVEVMVVRTSISNEEVEQVKDLLQGYIRDDEVFQVLSMLYTSIAPSS